MTLVETTSAETDLPRGGPGVIDVDRARLYAQSRSS